MMHGKEIFVYIVYINYTLLQNLYRPSCIIQNCIRKQLQYLHRVGSYQGLKMILVAPLARP